MASRGINLHPSGHHPSSITSSTFDIIIVGAGPVANFAEERLSRSGLSVAIIAGELYGGDCHYFACVPSKALLRPLEALNAARAVGGAREAVGKRGLDVEAVFKRRDTIVSNWNDNEVIGMQAEPWGSTVIRGIGRISGTNNVTVQPHGEEKKYDFTANHAVIVATGSTHIIPDIPGFEELEEGREMWINRDATASNVVPEHLIILGAGAVGVEMATFYSGVGSKVTLITSSASIIPRVEPEAAKLVRESLQASGVDIRFSTTVEKIEKQGPNKLSVTLANGDKIDGTVLLNAIGRKPRTTDLGLETIGVAGDGAPLKTEASMAVQGTKSDGTNWLYAVGDVNALGPTTHMGVYQARIASNNILNNIRDKNLTPPPHCVVRETMDFGNSAFPQVIFTEPSIATVGPTLAQAKAAGLQVRAVDSNFAIPGAMLYGDTPGWARWIVEEGSEKLLGATYCCLEASEFINAASVAIVGRMTVKDLVHVVPPFPSRGEILTYLVNAAGY